MDSPLVTFYSFYACLDYNPKEQKIWALLLALPRKWNLQGRVVGSDLGNNCFQFRFEREEDIRRVLDNRPYHFAYWMVILQRWEPVISNSFPSMIPCWIKIKGLPLHYWHDDMVCRVGQEIGTLENHELTKTTARVRVSVDGLKPLIKEAIVEFDSGEEISVTLEYERLESHCSCCFSLLHPRKYCPSNREEDLTWSKISTSNIEMVRYSSDPGYPKLDEKKRTEPAIGEANTIQHAFKARVDRHGNPFGERVSTKQTRIPPPFATMRTTDPSTQSWFQKTTKEGPLQNPPQYTKGRYTQAGDEKGGRDLFSQRSQGQWRPKQVLEADAEGNRDPVNQNQDKGDEDSQLGTPLRILDNQTTAKQAVMEDLHEVTRQYLNCADPVEAAARRQRVLYTDANGLMEETAARILASSQALHHNIELRHGIDSNPVTAPPRQEDNVQVPILQSRADIQTPPTRLGEDMGLTNLFNESIQGHSQEETRGETARSTRIKSVIVSPLTSQAGPQEENSPLIPADGETLGEAQAKARRRLCRSTRRRPVRYSPNILRGSSSKKRKLSQIQNSPIRGMQVLDGGPNRGKTRKTSKKKSLAETSHSSNPPIQLIPASIKRNPDFRVSPHPGP